VASLLGAIQEIVADRQVCIAQPEEYSGFLFFAEYLFKDLYYIKLD
jgi:hypothetical protein